MAQIGRGVAVKFNDCYPSSFCLFATLRTPPLFVFSPPFVPHPFVLSQLPELRLYKLIMCLMIDG